jgi:methionyl-tRNA formyltransferase
MATRERLRCVIVGEGALPIVCGEILSERGHEILALVSPDQGVKDWGQSSGIRCATNPDELAGLIAGEQLDYLFSIGNFQKLPGSVLSAARRYAINYHDAPLPRYAGSHATSWALLNGETRHAVTWHVLTGRIDAGDIVKQVPVDIEPDDTALTLNAKCFEAAVEGFRALLDDMEADAVAPRPQDSSERSFYRLSQRPSAGCTLRFDAPAGELDALMRALDFGPYRNPLGLPKIAIGESFAIVTELDLLEGRSGDIPGTMVAITPDYLIVTTADEDIALGGFLTIDGMPMSVTDVVERGGFEVGKRVAPVEEARAARLDALCAELAEHEPFWLAQLIQARPTHLPFALQPAGPLRRTASHTVRLDAEIRSLALPAGERAGDGLLVVFMTYLAWLTGAGGVDIAYSCMQFCSDIGGLGSFISTCLPLRMHGNRERSFRELTQTLREQLKHVRARRSYVRDAPVRDPALRAQLATADTSAWPIGVELLDGADDMPTRPPPSGRVLTVRIAPDGNTCTLLYDPDVLDPSMVERMTRQWMAFLKALPANAELPIGTLPLDAEIFTTGSIGLAR